MKTFIEKLFLQFESAMPPMVSNPLKVSVAQRKRKAGQRIPPNMLSPECFNVRGTSKKVADLRRTPAP